jgi:transcriptional regulator with XRE-family HTH domain
MDGMIQPNESERGPMGKLFPRYLKQKPSDKAALKWMGKKLKELRGEKSIDRLAMSVNVEPSAIKRIEQGEFILNLGKLRNVTQEGYKIDFNKLLTDCYEQNSKLFEKENQFSRPSFYSVRWEKSMTRPPTPLLTGGDRKSFFWAVPLRRLENQSIVVEFLELKDHRTKREEIGAVTPEFHGGVELLYVVYGAIDVEITPRETKKPLPSHLKAGDCIHFHSNELHSITNHSDKSSAFLYIVRLPNL